MNGLMPTAMYKSLQARLGSRCNNKFYTKLLICNLVLYPYRTYPPNLPGV